MSPLLENNDLKKAMKYLLNKMTTQTKAAVLFNLNKPLKIITLNLPEPKRWSTCKNFYSGICHTQLLEIAGKAQQDHLSQT